MCHQQCANFTPNIAVKGELIREVIVPKLNVTGAVLDERKVVLVERGSECSKVDDDLNTVVSDKGQDILPMGILKLPPLGGDGTTARVQTERSGQIFVLKH